MRLCCRAQLQSSGQGCRCRVRVPRWTPRNRCRWGLGFPPSGVSPVGSPNADDFRKSELTHPSTPSMAAASTSVLVRRIYLGCTSACAQSPGRSSASSTLARIPSPSASSARLRSRLARLPDRAIITCRRWVCLVARPWTVSPTQRASLTAAAVLSPARLSLWCGAPMPIGFTTRPNPYPGRTVPVSRPRDRQGLAVHEPSGTLHPPAPVKHPSTPTSARTSTALYSSDEGRGTDQPPPQHLPHQD